MKKEVRGDSMDLNQSIEFDQASADPSPQEDGKAMPMNPSMLPHHQITTKERREQNLDQFWNQQLLEIYNSTASKSSHLLPLARIKRVIKSDGEVKMISAETPILFAKACELFILELTLRAWLQTTACKRRTLQRCHISRAVREEGMLRNLLNRVVLCDHDKEDDVATECLEEMESLHNMQTPFPFFDLNGVSHTVRSKKNFCALKALQPWWLCSAI
ncbi:NUCLEAR TRANSCRIPTION FACTOR Y SUBUNIT C-10 [Salix koriyanagi]|uniref:NUCLEAR TRANSCRIPTION FACTOR Y SUBUNIT C-10 n=1 Tax=Salix koriyanagi TaxID=2511006 RepID=A0A9Q0VQP1_9ROSI|nr:NUCLEAR TRANSCRIPTION FACTOR Y SUBUNIT C-10 [Salix koriyanagi]